MHSVILQKEYFFRQNEIFSINKYTQGSDIRFHSHDFYEMFFITEGSGCHIINDKKYNVSKGSLFLVPPGVSHCLYNSSPNNSALTVYNCLFTAEFLEKLDTEDTGLAEFLSPGSNHSVFMFPIKLPHDYAKKIHTIYKDMYVEYTETKFGYSDMIKQYIMQILICIYRLSRLGCAEDTKPFSCDMSIEYIKRHYNADIHLEELAELNKMSSTYFCKKFKESTGMGVSEYIQKTRIENACEMLRSDDRKIIDIMMDVGYYDVKNFTAVFKKYVGMTPSQYKKQAS